MPAVLPEFEYDIFISYRQKDNIPFGHGNTGEEGWVTGFVHDLQKELEATFKEQISIYFDVNPKDGLLETHDVDASLASKLRSLVFIPIISQTYCDTRSFAWEHEFLAFKKMATEDSLGLKVRLPGGNVTSRILPVRIHELDSSDRELLENEIGPLRSIDFIYKSMGVNRPLVASDRKEGNQHQLLYRDQVNKVANAIKDIVSGAKGGSHSDHEKETVYVSTRSRRPGRVARILIGLALLSLAMLIPLSNYFRKPSVTDELDRSVAVLPFQNISRDPQQEYFSDGITIGITNALSNIQGLKVAGQTSAFQFKGRNADLKEIGEKLAVRNVLEGSVQRQGDRIRIIAQLIDINKGHQVWSQRFERNVSDGFAVQDEIAAAVTTRFMSTLGGDQPTERKHNPNPEAYDHYLKGLYYWNKRGKDLFTALDYFDKSARADSLFALAYAGTAQSYMLIGRYMLASPGEVMPKCRQAAERAIALDPSCVEAYTALAYEMMIYEWNWEEADRLFKLSINLNPNSAPTRYLYGQFLIAINKDFESAELQGRKAVELEPLNPICYSLLAGSYNLAGKYDEAMPYIDRALSLEPATLTAIQQKAGTLNALGRHEEALTFLQSSNKLVGDFPWVLRALCRTYSALGNKKAAAEVFEKLAAMSKIGYISPLILGETASLIGRSELSRAYLQAALKEHSSGVEGFIKDDPGLEKLLQSSFK